VRAAGERGLRTAETLPRTAETLPRTAETLPRTAETLPATSLRLRLLPTRRCLAALAALGLCLLTQEGCRLTRRPGRLRQERTLIQRSVAVTPPARWGPRFVPAYYTVAATIEDDLQGFSGTETVVYTNNTQLPLTEIVFHLFPEAAFLKAGKGAGLTVTSVRCNGRGVVPKGESELLLIPLRRQLAPGRETTLELAFAGEVPALPPRAKGLLAELVQELFLMGAPRYKGHYGIYGYGDGILNLGHWFPIVARASSVGWDKQPASGIGDIANFDVAHFDVTLTAPKGVEVVTTGVRVQRRGGRHGQRLRFYAGYSRDFAVQCSRSYQTVSTSVDGVRLNSHFLPEHATAGRRALDTARKCLQFYTSNFGRYAYRELDVAEAPLVGGAGGMEYPGLVTISSMLYDQPAGVAPGQEDSFAQVSDYLEDLLEFVVAHEVAHQWWNAAVGSNSKQHPFVDEALANYSALWYCESQHTPEEFRRIRYLNIDLGYQLYRFGGGRDLPVNQPAAAFPGTLAYSGIVYCKGALYYASLRKAMGEEQFALFLRNYYCDRLFRQATPGDVVEAARQASADKDAVDGLSAHWLDETHGDEDLGRLELAKFCDLFLASAIPDASVRDSVRSLAQTVDQLLGNAPAARQPTETSKALADVLKAVQANGGGVLEELLGAPGGQK